MQPFILPVRLAMAIALLATLPQVMRGQRVSPVLLAGFNSATMSSDEGTSSRRNGFVAGLSIEMPTSGVLSLQPEVLFAQKGVRDEADGFTGGIDVSYLEVPILARLGRRGGSKPQAYLLAGPAVAVRLSCTASFSGEGLSASTDCTDAADEEVDIKFRRIDVSGLVGAGLDFGPVSSGGASRFTVSIRYDHSFTDLVAGTDGGNSKHRVISIVGGIRFAGR